MPINTDLNVYPFFDDFDTTKNFHKILFNPARAVQSRELTQLQTILQDQIEMFGDNILREGTIVTGGNFVEEPALSFVKLQDKGPTSSGSKTVNIAGYVGYYAYGTATGLRSLIISTQVGLETQAPNYNTIWVKYLDGGTVGDLKVFNDGETIEIQSKDSNGSYSTIDKVVSIGNPSNAVRVSTGNGYGVRCGDGVIYQKGHFVRFADGITIVSKYDTAPDGVVVGFQTKEEIINSYIDQSLLDNANSFNNYNAPGADRLKLTPVLTTKTLADAIADEKFFAIQEYKSGQVVRRKLDTVYNKLGDMMARRTAEESGNYAVHGFDINVEESDNPNYITISVSPGVGYVNGYRVDLTNNFKIDAPQGIDYASDGSQNILANYGNYVVVNNMVGVFDFKNMATVQLTDAGGVTIGTAKARSITTNNSTTSQRFYLANIVMNIGKEFKNVTKIKSGASTTDIVTVGGAASLMSSSLNNLIFDVGQSHLKTVARKINNAAVATTNIKYVYRTSQSIPMANGVFNIGLLNGDEFPLGSSISTADLIAFNSATGEQINLSTASVSSTTSNMIVSGATTTSLVSPGGTSPPSGITVYYNAIKPAAAPMTKTLTTFTVTLTPSAGGASATGPWSLGVPDANSLTSVTVGGVDKTSSFVLKNGQTDTQYGLSTISTSLPVSGQSVIVTFQAFVPNTTAGQTYFSVDSYVGAHASTFNVGDIPSYVTEGGATIQLRDTIDFRPITAATFAGTVATNPSATESYTNLNLAAPFGSIELACDYYIGRYDKILMDENGQIRILSGKASENPVPPADMSDAMTLGIVYFPPYPSLPPSVANKNGKANYAVRFSKADNRRYTMSDIRKLDTKIDNFAYYISLSLMEQDTLSLAVTDDNGNDRFKNGIWVESFKDLRIADIYSTEFAAGIDRTDEVLQPKFNAFVINLKPSFTNNISDSAGVVDYGETTTLTNSPVTIIEQPYATSTKKCTTGLYSFTGTITLFPENDSSPDVVYAPNVNLDIDLTTPFVDFTESLSNFVPHQRSKNKKSTKTKTSGNIVTSTTTSVKNTSGLNSTSTVVSAEIGDFITDMTFTPYMRGREIKVSVFGLRPNTKFWPFFDQQDVSDFCAPAKYNESIANSTAVSTVVKDTTKVTNSGNRSEALRSDSAGNLYAVFYLPENTYTVGDKAFELLDVSKYKKKDEMTSYAGKIYSAFNFGMTKTGISSSTRIPEFNIASSMSKKTKLRKSDVKHSQKDPLIQSFIIDPDSSDEDSTLLTGVDLFFASKSDKAGVSVMIREMINGVPTSTTVPFSEVHLKTSDVNVSTNGAAVTSIKFNSPISIRTNVEYGLCIYPDGANPDYKVFISRTGETDLILKQVVTHDTNSGMIFTSTNDRTWTPYQNENMKFTLYSASFNTSSGKLVLEPNDVEFFELSNLVGQFEQGEMIYVSSNTFKTGLSFVAGSNIVNGSGTTFQTDLIADDWIFGNTTIPQLIKVNYNGPLTNTNTLVDVLPTVTANGVSWYKTVVATVSQFMWRDGINKLIVHNSSARKGLTSALDQIFKTGATVVGIKSGASATITVVNHKVSFVQPNIRRIDYAGTSTSLEGDFNTGVTNVTQNFKMPFNDSTYLKEAECTIPSKSNIITGTSKTTFTINLESPYGSITSSPVIDYAASSLICYEYDINNISTGENTTSGSARSKYVSKVSNLADEMDAVDMKVFLNGYRPIDTDIKVYVKLIAAADSRPPFKVGWTEMTLSVGSNLYSSGADREDFREFEFSLPSTASAASDTASYSSGVFQYKDDAGAVFNTYKAFAFKVVLLSKSYKNAPRVADIRALSLT